MPMGFGWAWVQYYVHGRAWVDVGAILFFMGGRGCNIIFHGWAWVGYYCSWVGMDYSKTFWMSSHSKYDEFEDELEENHDNGTEILVVSNLDARIELEFSMYETYKVTDLKKKNHCSGELSIASESRYHC
jgi:hypothetical protein